MRPAIPGGATLPFHRQITRIGATPLDQIGVAEDTLSIVRSPYLLVVIALVAAACEGTGDRMAQTSTTTSPAPIATRPPVDVSSLSWSRVARDDAVLGRDGDQSMNSVTSGGPGFVAAGADDSDGDPDAAVWTSTDGITWSRVPHDEAVFGGDDDQSMSSLIAGGPGLVAAGADGTNLRGLNIDAAVWTSIDGFTWSRVPHEDGIFGGDGDQLINSVVVGGPGLVAVGSETIRFDVDAAVWTSSDGITWSRVPHDEAVFGGRRDQVMLSVVAGSPGLVAVGSAGTGGDHDAAVWTSPDGIGWSRVVHDEEVFGGESIQVMHHVTVAGPGLVALGLDGPFDASSAAAWTSSDGISWSRVPHDEELFGGRGGQAMVGRDDRRSRDRGGRVGRTLRRARCRGVGLGRRDRLVPVSPRRRGLGRSAGPAHARCRRRRARPGGGGFRGARFPGAGWRLRCSRVGAGAGELGGWCNTPSRPVDRRPTATSAQRGPTVLAVSQHPPRTVTPLIRSRSDSSV